MLTKRGCCWITMGFIKKFFANTRKPQGFLGKLMVGGMNKGHAKCADWGMELYTGEDLTDILKKSGFVDIKVSQHMQKHWLAVTGKHP